MLEEMPEDSKELAKQRAKQISGTAAYRMNEAKWLRDSRTGGERIELGGREYLKLRAQQEARVYAALKIGGALLVGAIILFFWLRH